MGGGLTRSRDGPASTGLYRFRRDATGSMFAADRSLSARLFTVRVIFTSWAGDARGAPIAREALAPRQEGRSGLAVSRKHLSDADQTSRPAPATKTPDSSRRFASGVPEPSLSVALARNHPCVRLKATQVICYGYRVELQVWTIPWYANRLTSFAVLVCYCIAASFESPTAARTGRITPLKSGS